MSRRSLNPMLNVPEKATRVLHIILIGMLLILARVWQLSIIEHEQKLEEAKKPRKRLVIEPAKRGTIRDRFNLPLAMNKVKYQAGIVYAQIREIPSQQIKRKEYVKNLSQLVAEVLDLDAERVEDMIWAKAVFYHTLPLIVKDDITEEQYYRLKMLEKDWPGIVVQRGYKRIYPQGKVAGGVIGYMGAINREEYEKILQELKALRAILKGLEEDEEFELPANYASIKEVKQRLKELEEHAYAINDYVGKSGIEAHYEEELRGSYGKRTYDSNAQGTVMRELPGARNPLPGQRLLLTLSSELQEYAEELLTRSEKFRADYEESLHPGMEDYIPFWMRGGAIVAMDPNNGELLALASYPRLDPNDFVDASKKDHVYQWLEGEGYIASLWDGKQLLEKEIFHPKSGTFSETAVPLTWERYLNFILPKEHEVRTGLDTVKNVRGAVELQRQFGRLMAISSTEDPIALVDSVYSGDGHAPFVKGKNPLKLKFDKGSEIRQKLDPFFKGVAQNYNKIFLLDLCRLLVDETRFDEQLLKVAGGQSLSDYREVSQAYTQIEDVVKKMVREHFHAHDFTEWRKVYQKGFLEEKREEEKLAKAYAKPYIDYLDEKEKELFNAFWNSHRQDLILAFVLGISEPILSPYDEELIRWHEEFLDGAHQGLNWSQAYAALNRVLAEIKPDVRKTYLETLRPYQELARPLYGKYRLLRSQEGQSLEKHLAAAFYPIYGYGYSRSHAYRQAAVQGSIFKLVTGYAALKQRYEKGYRDLNPLTIIDQKSQIGFFTDGSQIPQIYKGGRMIRSLSRNIGQVDFVKALEHSSNPYFSLLAGDHLAHPNDLIEAARQFSYGVKTGIDLPGEYPGHLPQDLAENRTGLYATAIGQHSLVVTPLQTAVMLSSLSNGGKVLQPKVLLRSVGPNRTAEEMGEFCEPLSFIGISFPLFGPFEENEKAPRVQNTPIKLVRVLDLPNPVWKILLDGMQSVVHGISPESLKLFYKNCPEAVSCYKDLQNQIIGKTSSSEANERLNFDRLEGTQKMTHIWFGGIAYKEPVAPSLFMSRDKGGKPELIVVVYFRYTHHGKFALPIASQIVKKWRDIQDRHK